MNRSETTAALAGALAKAQGAMRAAELDRKNPFFNSRYASLASIWEAIRQPLTENELAISQVTYPDDGLLILETVLLHSSGEWISAQLVVKPVKDDPQGVGSAISYARRYGLSAIVDAVSDEDDDGNDANDKAESKTQPRPHIPTEAHHAQKTAIAAMTITTPMTAGVKTETPTPATNGKPLACNITKAIGFTDAAIAMVNKLEEAGIHTGYKLKTGGYDFEHMRYSLAAEGYLTLSTEQVQEALGKLEARLIHKVQEMS